ncbi:M14 family metallopeptidase [Paraburkholderia sediminicola]|uniref:M14 family metallopeptidase n=1 Tax=Paraburkholderia sediminicola TaxID=458836 RepID=UPI0038B87B65
MQLIDFFSTSYAHARERFLHAASKRTARIKSWTLSGRVGLHGEALATDAAFIGNPDSDSVIVVSSGVHGIEGYAGSGCQVALLRDDALLRNLDAQGKAMLLVHAVNPFGFSFGRRTNEDNVDLNRNFVDFSAALPSNPDYASVHPLMLPAIWPPAPPDVGALHAYQSRHGMTAFQRALSSGQHSHPDGLFFGGTQPSWSRLTLDEVLDTFVSSRRRAIWIDIHTGLGPHGFGQKILIGDRSTAATGDPVVRARAIWGADVVSLAQGQSVSSPVTGAACGLLQAMYPEMDSISLAVEFGTLPMHDTIDALRFDQWIYRCMGGRHDEGTAAPAREAMKAAFNPDSDGWRGMVWGQMRAVLEQAVAT